MVANGSIDAYHIHIKEVDRYKIPDLQNELKKLDLIDKDIPESLEVVDFIKNKMAKYVSNNFTTVYSVRYYDELVGFFTMSMSHLLITDATSKKINNQTLPRRYPAVYIGTMAVDKKFRNKKLGFWICKYCMGRARKISTQIACSVIILQASEKQAKYFMKQDFKKTNKRTAGNKVLLYQSIW